MLCKRWVRGVVLVNVTAILKRVAVDIRAADSFCILRGLEPKELATSAKQLLFAKVLIMTPVHQVTGYRRRSRTTLLLPPCMLLQMSAGTHIEWT